MARPGRKNARCEPHAARGLGFQKLNDHEIVTSLQAESDPVDDETDEDEDNNNESSKYPSNAGAFSALETAMEWYEQQSKCCPSQLLLLKRIRDLAAKERRCTMVQRKMCVIVIFASDAVPYIIMTIQWKFSEILTIEPSWHHFRRPYGCFWKLLEKSINIVTYDDYFYFSFDFSFTVVFSFLERSWYNHFGLKFPRSRNVPRPLLHKYLKTTSSEKDSGTRNNAAASIDFVSGFASFLA
ncbi:uncharacterized protein TNCV_94421 [Trichonephila clavipes]|nr:uncharacterized protein TNCV_94421 [Trichonephila clavipes]